MPYRCCCHSFIHSFIHTSIIILTLLQYCMICLLQVLPLFIVITFIHQLLHTSTGSRSTVNSFSFHYSHLNHHYNHTNSSDSDYRSNNNNNTNTNTNTRNNSILLLSSQKAIKNLILTTKNITATTTTNTMMMMGDHNDHEQLLDTLRKELLDVIKSNTAGGDGGGPIEFINEQYQNDTFKRKLYQFVVLNEINKSKSSHSDSDSDSDSDLDSSAAVLLKRRLLLNKPILLLEEMLLADGPVDGNYVKAFEIYEEIQNESEYNICCGGVGSANANGGDNNPSYPYPVLHRLAIAISLVHSTPMIQTNPIECNNDEENMVDNDNDNDNQPDEKYIDPVRRYLNYECSFLNGELDSNFNTLSIFELRYVVDGDESDEISCWGRTTLQNYYPDHVLNSIDKKKTNSNNTFLYGSIVRTDIPYGSSRVSNDNPKLHKYQNILMNGGICGRRAFFGRFILRAFGIPTTARPSKGHAALCHWNVNGIWDVNLGGGWGNGWTTTQYVKDLDFYATTQARLLPNEYKKVKFAQWIGDVLNEKQVYGIHDEKVKGRRDMNNIPIIDLSNLTSNDDIGIWYRTSLQIQQTIIDQVVKNKNLPKNKNNDKKPITTIAETVMKQKQIKSGISYNDGNTVIRIPAGSYADPRKTKDVKVMKSFITSHDGIDNEQIYLPSFATQGTTILRGGTWKDTGLDGLCNSGARLLSGGYGRYENWGLRVALTIDNEIISDTSCPDPTLIISLNDDDDDNDDNDDNDNDTPATATANTIIEFVYIPPGTFIMGGTSDKDGRFNCVEIPHHPVRITKGFYIGKYPVTQKQYMAIRNKNPSKSTKDPNCPVDNINVEDAIQFCVSASELTGCDIRLPTEAEWEYSSRGSTNGTASANSMWFFGDNSSSNMLDDYAWHKGNSNGKSHPVGLKKSNTFGLYDIYGNVCERVSDTYKKEYYNECSNTATAGLCEDPNGPSQGIKSKFKYTNIKIPSSGGKYQLTAKVCTVTVGQRLNVSLNEINDDGSGGDDTTTVIMELPYTCGEWQESKPVILHLKNQNDNNNNITLYFWRDNPPQYGVSIKEFTLTKID